MLVLVTGGAGFIGSHIVEALLQRGEQVRVLDNFSTGKRENLAQLGDRIEVIEGDIRSYHLVREAVHQVEVVLHQAALPSVPRSVRDPITTNEVNVAGTLNILQAAKEAGVKRVVYASSSSVYGNTPELPKREDMATYPLSPYAVAKLAGEKYCQVFSRVYGLSTVILRYFNVFGPRQDPSSQYAAVIPKFITAIINNQRPVIYGDGEQTRDFSYVTNVVYANLLALAAECEFGMPINCACQQSVSLNRLVSQINRVLGKDIKPVYTDAQTGDIKHSLADIRRAEQCLGYRPKVGFEEGLTLTVEAILRQWHIPPTAIPLEGLV